VDQARSEFEWDGLADPSMTVSELVLNENALGDNDRTIRLRFVPAKILFREDLMQGILGEAFSGFAFIREVFGDYDVYGQ